MLAVILRYNLAVDAFFIKYSAWCAHNCIVVNLIKSNYLSFNVDNIVLTIND